MVRYVLFAFFLVTSLSKVSPAFELEAGTMMLGGRFAMPYEYDYKRNTLLSLQFQPEFSYFLWKNLSLGGGLNLAYDLYDSTASERGPVVWGFSLGAKYYLPFTDNLFGFTGFSLSLEQNDIALVSTRWAFEVPIGLLFMLNDKVGLTFGVPVAVRFKSTSFFERLVITPGYFGAAAFF